MKLNAGCGNKYKKGWINLDSNREVRADVYHDLNKFPLPFKDNHFDKILLDNVLEHIPNYLKLIDELHRITKKGGIIIIYTPHTSSIYSFKHLDHIRPFGVGSFDIYKPKTRFTGERVGKARFCIKKERLIYFHHSPKDYPILSMLPINWMFNINRTWQIIVEKFLPLKFDEYYVRLEVVK